MTESKTKLSVSVRETKQVSRAHVIITLLILDSVVEQLIKNKIGDTISLALWTVLLFLLLRGAYLSYTNSRVSVSTADRDGCAVEFNGFKLDFYMSNETILCADMEHKDRTARETMWIDADLRVWGGSADHG